MIAHLLGIGEFMPSDDFYDMIGQEQCRENTTTLIVCESILFLICGPDISEIDPVINCVIVAVLSNIELHLFSF